jgi:outer membrane protein TolC
VLLYEKASLVKIIKANTERLISELGSSDLRIDIFQKAFLANDRSRDNLTLQFQTSNVSLLELLQAERDYLESSENMVFNQRAILLSSYTQLAILGRLLNYISDQSKKS